MELWQYRLWAADQHQAVRAKVNPLLDALEVLLDIAHRKEVGREEYEEALARVYQANPVHVWIVLAVEHGGGARVVGLELTEGAARALAVAWQKDALAGELGAYWKGKTIYRQDEEFRAGADVFLSWDEHEVRR